MSHLVITLLRICCDEVTDDFLEGLEDEFGWRLTVFDVNGGTTKREEIPMPGMEKVEAGSEHTTNRELARLGPECQEAWLEFWDQDTFSSDDLLGRLEIRRDGTGRLTLTAGLDAQDLGGGAYRLVGEQGRYVVWLKLERV